MRNGECYPRPPLEHPTDGDGSGLLPTPRAQEGAFNKSPGANSVRRLSLVGMARTGLWPTPTIHGNHNNPKFGGSAGWGLAQAAKLWPTPRSTDGTHGGRVTPRKARNGGNLIEAVSTTDATGQLNPTWVEWLMGFPQGWTDLKPLEMPRFREWLQQHGGNSPDENQP